LPKVSILPPQRRYIGAERLTQHSTGCTPTAWGVKLILEALIQESLKHLSPPGRENESNYKCTHQVCIL
jgi:hypothetical protein